jgi:hypothetical protein
MADFPPEMNAFLNKERKQQTNFVMLAQAKQNVNQTTKRAISVMDNLINRGEQINKLEQQSDELLYSSNVFRLKTTPWWKRILNCECFPQWWCQKFNDNDNDNDNWRIDFVE